jgi:hypothetical protein
MGDGLDALGGVSGGADVRPANVNGNDQAHGGNYNRAMAVFW